MSLKKLLRFALRYRELVVCVRRRAQPAQPLSTAAGGLSHSPHDHNPTTWTIPSFKTLLAPPWGLGSLQRSHRSPTREASWVQRGQLSLYIMHAGPITLVKCSAALCEASARAGDGYAPRLCISEGAQKNRVVGAHRWEWGCEEAHRALLYLPPVLPRGCASRIDQNQEQLSHAPTLRADPASEQQVHSKVSLRRAVDAV